MFGMKSSDLLGRIWIPIDYIPGCKRTSPEDKKDYLVYTHTKEKWRELIFDATNSKDGALLIGYTLMPIEMKKNFPVSSIDIKPKCTEGILTVPIIGIRELIPSINLLAVKKLTIEFDVSGDSNDPVVTDKHSVLGGACNFFDTMAINIDVPLDIRFSPVLTVFVYDHVPIFGKRLVGLTNIALEKYCK
jgi:hypothetical protein